VYDMCLCECVLLCVRGWCVCVNSGVCLVCVGEGLCMFWGVCVFVLWVCE